MAFRNDILVTKLRLGDNKRVDDGVFDATITLGAEAANAIKVSIQLLDARGKAVTERIAVEAYLSSDSHGDALVAPSATLTIAASTNGIAIPYSAANSAGHTAMKLVSEAAGTVDVSITETSGAATYYLVLVSPITGKLIVSGAITFAA